MFSLFNNSENKIEETIHNMEETAENFKNQFLFEKYDYGFANVYLNETVSGEVINPIINFILNENLAKSRLNVINLFIDTDGGDFQVAMKLIDVINMSEIPIRTIGWGRVESAGLLILMSGKERLLTRNCSILSHHVSVSYPNFVTKVNNVSFPKALKVIYDQVLRLYMECTNKTKKYILEHLLKEDDVYLTPEEAIKHNLADGFVPQGQMDWMLKIQS